MAIEGPVRLRAVKACKRCNSRRVKCDALEIGTPCSRCKASDIHPSDSVLIQSKRGTYARKKAEIDHPSKDSSPQIDNRVATATVVESISTPRDIPSERTTTPRISPRRNVEMPTVSPEIQRSDTALSGSFARPPPPPWATTGQDERVETPTAAITQGAPSTTVSNVQTSIDDTSPKSGLIELTSTSYRELSWTAVLDQFLVSRCHENKKNAIDKCFITYLGETFPLSLVLEDFKDNGKRRLHHPGPAFLESQTTQSEKPAEAQHPAYMLLEDIAFLNAKQAFEHPPQEIMDALIGSFMDRVHPVYPIVNRRGMSSTVQSKQDILDLASCPLLRGSDLLSTGHSPSSRIWRS